MNSELKSIDSLNKAFDGLESDLAQLLSRYRQLKAENTALQIEVKTRRIVGDQMAGYLIPYGVQRDRMRDLLFSWSNIRKVETE